MKKQLKKAFNGVTDSFSQMKIKEEPVDQSETLYGATGKGHYQRFRNSSPSRKFRKQNEKQEGKGKKPRQNTKEGV